MQISPGKVYEPVLYEVSRDRIKRYATAVGETSPVYLDAEAARAAGYADVVAPPMFAAVYAWPAVTQWIFDPEHGIGFSRFIHTSQRFRWGSPVIAGDEITSVNTLKTIYKRGHISFYECEIVSKNRLGETVAVGNWTNVFKGVD